jgi:hypothetical protein
MRSSSNSIGKLALMTAGALGVASFASRAGAGPVITEPAGVTSNFASDAELDAQLAGASITPPEFNLLSLPKPETAALDPLSSTQAPLPPVIPLPPAVIPGLVVLGLVVRATRKNASTRVVR